MKRILTPLLFAWIFAATHAIAMDSSSPIGQKIESFALQDFRGKSHMLKDYDDKKLVVVAFLGVECPLAKLYASRLVEIAEDYKDNGVIVIGVDANSQDSITEIAAYARIHKIDFPVLKDAGNQVADKMGAVRTPEVFLLDRQRVVRYWGRIDDQYGVDYVREAPKRNDLVAAIDELLAGKQVSVAETEAPGCFIGRQREPNEDCEITYGEQISRILQNRCVECHRAGEIAPFSLTEYEEVAGWAETIAEVIDDGRMPPWHADPKHGSFQNDRHMTDEEKQMVYKWVANGAPQGNLKDLPKPKTYTAGWQLPREPDLVIPVSPKPFTVPVKGEVRYQWFSIDPGFKEDKWVQAAELLPGNHSVVHHILAFARGSDGKLRGGGTRGYLVGYVPGLRVKPLPPGMAKRIPAGSKIVFQVHYTPVGSEQLDQSKLGLVFIEPKDVTHEVTTTSAVQPSLRIPPGADNYQATAATSIKHKDAQLLSLMPHMHLRGKAFRYEASYPDGQREILLDIPSYDFNWQTSYSLTELKSLPMGTRINCTAYFDNSEFNLNNPNPDDTVRWGDQTWEEMMIGYFDIALPRNKGDSDATPSRASLLIQRYDKNGDEKVERDEVPERIRRVFDGLDRDKDGVIDEQELKQTIKRLR